VCLFVLRPSNSLLGSSRATHRATLRAERLRAFSQITRLFKGTITRLVAIVIELGLLWLLPFAYLAAAYLALDIPARWLTHRDAYGRWGLLMFAAAVAIALVGITRARRDAPPIAPVRPKFAKAMLALSWVAAVLCTIGDLAY
jgi:hypothetical protein